MRSRLATTTLLGAAILLAGCTAKENGNATGVQETPAASSTSTPGTSESTTSTSDDEVPKVETPLDVSAFIDKPCTGLTRAQTDELQVSGAKQDTEPTGQYCVWTNPKGGYVNLAFVAGQGGLRGVYRGNAGGQYKLFKELPDVAGYPAVIAEISDQRKNGDCGIAIGVSDDTTLSVGTAQSMDKVGTGDPCQVTVRVAEMILKTVKAGG